MIRKNGATDQSIVIFIASSDGSGSTGADSDSTGLSLWYRLEGSTVTTIAVTTLAAQDSTHVDGGFEPLSDGHYRLDAPDAAFTGAIGVQFGGSLSSGNDIIIAPYIDLVTYDPYATMGTTDAPLRYGDIETIMVSYGVAKGIKKNTALPNWQFPMLTSGGAPSTGQTVTGVVFLDASTSISVSGSIAEIGGGMYQFDAAAADTNGVDVLWVLSSTGDAEDTVYKFRTISSG
jgi:hypothetical protein